MSTQSAPVLPERYTLAGASYATQPASPARCLALFSAIQNVDLPVAQIYAAALALTSQSAGVPWKPGGVLAWSEAVFDAFVKKGVKLSPDFFDQGRVAWEWVKHQIPFEKEVKEAEDFSGAPQGG